MRHRKEKLKLDVMLPISIEDQDPIWQEHIRARMVLYVWEFVLDVAAVSRLTEGEKDLENLLLRQQLRIVERKQERGPQIPRWQKVPLAVVAVRLKQKAQSFAPSTGGQHPVVQASHGDRLASGSGATQVDLPAEKTVRTSAH